MTTKQFWTATSLSTLLCLSLVGTLLKALLSPPPTASAPAPISAPPLDLPAAIAVQKAKLQLTDGRTATFRFATAGGSLICTAAVGLDQILTYNLVPVGDPPLPDPAPSPAPGPAPGPNPGPAPDPRR